MSNRLSMLKRSKKKMIKKKNQTNAFMKAICLLAMGTRLVEHLKNELVATYVKHVYTRIAYK